MSTSTVLLKYYTVWNITGAPWKAGATNTITGARNVKGGVSKEVGEHGLGGPHRRHERLLVAGSGMTPRVPYTASIHSYIDEND